MQYANCLVALGGDANNTVPKYGVSAAEIAVLCAIHGEGSVFDIEPLPEEVNVSSLAERDRLLGLYKAKDADSRLVVMLTYPGRMPDLHQTIESLELDESLFKATQRVSPKKATAKKGAAKKAEAKAPANAPADDDATAVFDQPEDIMS